MGLGWGAPSFLIQDPPPPTDPIPNLKPSGKGAQKNNPEGRSPAKSSKFTNIIQPNAQHISADWSFTQRTAKGDGKPSGISLAERILREFFRFRGKKLLTKKRTEKRTAKCTEKRNFFSEIFHRIFPEFPMCVFFSSKNSKMPPKNLLQRIQSKYSSRHKVKSRVPMWQGSKLLICPFDKQNLRPPRPATGVSRALRARSVSGCVPESVPENRGVSGSVPRSVPGTLLETLRARRARETPVAGRGGRKAKLILKNQSSAPLCLPKNLRG